LFLYFGFLFFNDLVLTLGSFRSLDRATAIDPGLGNSQGVLTHIFLRATSFHDFYRFDTAKKSIGSRNIAVPKKKPATIWRELGEGKFKRQALWDCTLGHFQFVVNILYPDTPRYVFVSCRTPAIQDHRNRPMLVSYLPLIQPARPVTLHLNQQPLSVQIRHPFLSQHDPHQSVYVPTPI
jgi:hypothetical protein